MVSTVTAPAIWPGDGKTEETQIKNYGLIPKTEEFRAMQPSNSKEKNINNQVSPEAQFAIMIQCYKCPASSCSHKDKILLANGAVVTTWFAETEPDKLGYHDKIQAK